MVLEQLRDGAQRQLSAYDEGTRKLTFILCLPLLDGVFATLLVTGAVATFSDMIAVALTIFSGAGALAILWSYSETVNEARSMVVKAVPPLFLGALAVSLVAPIFEQLIYVGRMEIAAGLALIVIAGQLADFEYAETLSVPAILITGLALSVKNPAALTFSTSYVAPALLTVLVASIALYVASFLVRLNLSLTYIRRGSALVLLLISLSLFGFSIPSELSLLVFAGSVVAAML